MATLSFKKMLPGDTLERLEASFALVDSRRLDGSRSVIACEAAVIRINAAWQSQRWERVLSEASAAFAPFRGQLSPQAKAMFIRSSASLSWQVFDGDGRSRSELLGRLQAATASGKLWHFIVLPEAQDSFLLALGSSPVVSDSLLLDTLLRILARHYEGQPAHSDQRPWQELEAAVMQGLRSGFFADSAALIPSGLKPSLPQLGNPLHPAGTLPFRLAPETWSLLRARTDEAGLGVETLASLLLQAALYRMGTEPMGQILLKPSLSSQSQRYWQSHEPVIDSDRSLITLIENSRATPWLPLPPTEPGLWPKGLWIALDILAVDQKDHALQILASDPGCADILWLCKNTGGEGLLCWREQGVDQNFIACLLRIINELAELWAKNPELTINQLSIEPIVLENWQQWNKTETSFSIDQCIHQLLAAALQSAGDRIAILSRHGKLSFRELDTQSKQLAQYLMAQGIGVGDRIGIALPRTPGLMIALLGVLRSGAAYVPLDPSFPDDRLQFMLEDSGVKACICDEQTLTLVAKFCRPMLWQRTQVEFAGLAAEDWQEPKQDPSSMAYLIYTSGSTGQPKGVMLGHRSVVNFLLSMQDRPGMNADDRVLAVTTLSFDIAVLELLLPLLCGASIYLAHSEETKDGKVLLELMESQDITIFQATPSNFRLLLDAGWSGTSLRKALCGGEAFPIDVARRLLPIVPEVWNMYGPTETTVWSTIHRITAADGMIPIGRPIANTQIYILDAELQPVLPGTKGELYIGGSGLALGYLGRDDLTAERFQNIPSLNKIAYKTGDIARYTWSGELEIFGRSDHQVKLHGYRMELGEIEACVASLPDIEQCIVLVKEFAAGDPRLVAYVSCKGLFQEREIRQKIKEKLPRYMLPAHYVLLDSMPLTPNGKVDRKQLPHPLELIAAEDSALNKTMIEPLELLPMTPSQMRMLFTEEMLPETTVHNLVAAWRLDGPLDTKALEKALHTLVIEQECMRMAIVKTDQGHALKIFPSFVPRITIENSKASQVEEKILAKAQQKIDIYSPENFSFGLLHTNEQACVFYSVMHHLFWDGFSYGVFWRNLQRIYRKILSQEAVDAEVLDFNFSHYALLRQSQKQSNEFARDLLYWQRIYQTPPEPLELAYDFTRPSELQHRADSVFLNWPTELDQALQKSAKELGCSIFHLVLSAYFTLLYRISGQDDLVIGTPVLGRQQLESFELLGNFINVVAIRQAINPGISFARLVTAVKKSSDEAMTHGGLPFEDLIAALNLPRDLGRTPLYNTMLFFQDSSLQKISLDEICVETIQLSNKTVDTDLILAIDRQASRTLAAFNFRADLWQKSTISSLAESFTELIMGLMQDSSSDIRTIPLLSSRQFKQQTETWNQSSFALPKPDTLCSLLDRRAAEKPMATAVQDLFGQSLSWQDFERQAQQLSILLRKEGIKPGSVIGICLNRKLDLLVGLWAILRAGATYLPLDPQFPAERLQYMTNDAQAVLILSESSCIDALQACPIPILCLDKDRQGREQLRPELELGPGPELTDLAYIIYTSGSTGKPKGVEIQHAAVAHFIHAFAAAVELPKEPRTLAITTISFDISVLELFGTLILGGTVILVDKEALTDGPRLIQAIADHQINLLQATPATWRVLLAAQWEGNAELTALCGGEALPRDLVRELYPRVKALWNVYGPTEATVWATAERIESAEAEITIGRVLPYYEAYIFDAQMQTLPIGAIGGLYLGGPALALAYHERDDLTAERFLPHPYRTGERIYDTGDLCRYRADSRIEYIARKDKQIKLRGFRIELGEIEAAVSALPSVKQSIVIVREDNPGDQRLVAYVCLHEGQSLDLLTLQQNLRDFLPTYMLPSQLVSMQSFPLTGSGKIDQKALPKPTTAAEQAFSQAHETELSPEQEKIASIWRELIGIKRVRPRDNFFDLGGHSLLALKVLQRIQSELGMQFKIRDLLLMDLEQLATQWSRSSAGATPGQEGST